MKQHFIDWTEICYGMIQTWNLYQNWPLISHIALGKWPNIYDNHLVIYRMGNLFISLLLLLFSHAVVCDSLWPCGLQHARPPCSLPFPEVCPSSHLLHRWCHLAISWCSLLLLSSIFSSIRTFSVSQLFASDDRSTGVSTSVSVLPMSIQGWFPLRLTDWFDLLAVRVTLSSLPSALAWRHLFFNTLPSLQSRSHNSTWPLGRP